LGAYIYRLKGTKAFEEFIIEGKKEKVYDYVYWYKPYYAGMFEKEPSWMKPIKMLGVRLEKAFKAIEPVKWVRHVSDDGVKDEVIMEWPTKGICIDDYNERYQNARQINVAFIQKA